MANMNAQGVVVDRINEVFGLYDVDADGLEIDVTDSLRKKLTAVDALEANRYARSITTHIGEISIGSYAKFLRLTQAVLRIDRPPRFGTHSAVLTVDLGGGACRQVVVRSQDILDPTIAPKLAFIRRQSGQMCGEGDVTSRQIEESSARILGNALIDLCSDDDSVVLQRFYTTPRLTAV